MMPDATFGVGTRNNLQENVSLTLEGLAQNGNFNNLGSASKRTALKIDAKHVFFLRAMFSGCCKKLPK